MLVSILFLFVLLSVVVLTTQNKDSNRTLVWLFYIIFIIITTFRSHDLPDYENYYNYFVFGEFERAEVGFRFYIESLKHIISSPELLFLSVALLSVGLKCSVIERVSPFVWGSLLIYISYFFIIHDMIQIRVAVASALLLWSTKFLTERNATKFFSLSILAILFHYSAAIILPFWFINPNKSHKRLYLLMIPAAYMLAIMGYSFGHLVGAIPVEQIQTLWTMYEKRMEFDGGTEINIFNSMHLIRCAMSMFIMFNIDKISKYVPTAVVWAKMYIISLVAFLLLSDIPVLSFRISELLQIVEILLIPSIVLVPKYRQLGRYMIIGFAAVCIFVNVFYNQYIV